MTTKTKHDDNSGHTFKSSSNGEWTVVKLSSSDSVRAFHVGNDESQLENFSEVSFLLHLKRKPQFVQIYLILPCILLIWVSSITFVLPVKSGEKVGLISTILLSLFVFLLIVSENVPHTSDCVPLIGKFFFACIGLVSLGMVFTVTVLNLSHRSSKNKMPVFFQRLLYSNFAHFFCFSFSKPHRGFSEYQVLFKNSANATTEISPPWSEASVSVTYDKQWEQLAKLMDRLFMIIYLILCFSINLYIFSV